MGDGELAPVTALVDTGAGHSMMPESLLARLGLRPLETFLYAVADGRQMEYGYGMARFGLEGREFPCPVIFGPEGQFLFGATSLQIFNLKVDPVEERLVRREFRARAI
jgi:predicted aspartyl protease